MRFLFVCGLVAGCCLPLALAKPVSLSAPAYLTGTIVDKQYSFAFDLPSRWQAEHAPDIPEYWISYPDRGMLLTVGVERVRWYEPLLYPRDTLLSYAAQNLDVRYSWIGNNSFASADSLLAFRYDRTRTGLPVLEFSFRVHEEHYGPEDDDDDTSATAPQVVDSAAVDTTLSTVSNRFGGPSWLVDIRAPGRRVVVRVELQCEGEPSLKPSPSTLRVARGVVRSIRRI